jgi:hypothetical protein
MKFLRHVARGISHTQINSERCNIRLFAHSCGYSDMHVRMSYLLQKRKVKLSL